MSELTLSPTRPYLARAIYDWIYDNQLTPYIVVNAKRKNTFVPQQFVKDGQIVLNIAAHAVHQFTMNNDAIAFSARFGGVSQDIYIPYAALIGIYARENGQGLFFDESEYPEDDAETEQTVSVATEELPKKKPSLRIVD